MFSPKHHFLKLARHNLRANTAVAKVLNSIDPNLIDKEVKSSFTSIRKTAFHIWDAEYIWLARLRTELLLQFPSKIAPASISKFPDGALQLLTFIEMQNDAFFFDSTKYKNKAEIEMINENAEILFHIFNHSSFHRGQLITLLHSLAYEGKMPRTDIIS